MSQAAALVAQLAAAGTPPELLAAVARELFLAEVERSSLADRRRNERERKARSREVTGQDVTGAEVTAEVSPLDSPPKVSPKPPSKNPPFKSPLPNLLRGVDLPEGVPAEPWLAFVRMRKAIPKVPFTEDAARGVVRKCLKLQAQGYDPAKLLWKAVDHGWRTVFANDDCKSDDPKFDPAQLSAEQWEERAQFYDKIGQVERAEDCRLRARREAA